LLCHIFDKLRLGTFFEAFGQHVKLVQLSNYIGMAVHMAHKYQLHPRMRFASVNDNKLIFNGDELQCDLDNRAAKCCWLNWSNNHQRNILPWHVATGKLDKRRFKSKFGTDKTPGAHQSQYQS